MIEAEFKRDLNNNYMILNCPEEISLNNYQICMLTTNAIRGMLKCNVRSADSKIRLYYEITSKQPLERVFEKQLMKYTDIQKLITEVKSMIESAEEYLLDSNSLIIEPEYIYMNVETEEMYFSYIPGYQKDISTSFHQLAEFVLNKIDHKDREGVVLGYELYQQTLEDNYSISSIMEHFYKKKKTVHMEYGEELIEEEKFLEPEEEIPEGNHKEDFQNNSLENQNKKAKNEKYSTMGIIVLLLILIAIACLVILNYKNRVNLPQVFGGCLLLGSLALYFYIQKIKKQKEELGKENVMVQIEEDENEKNNEEEEIIYTKIIRKEPEEVFGNTRLLGFRPQEGERMLKRIKIDEEEGEEDLFITRYPYLIGKIESIVDGVISNYMVSRIHAKISKENEKFYLTDLNSTNGTFLNGSRMESNSTLELKIGDEVCFGEVEFCFK